MADRDLDSVDRKEAFLRWFPPFFVGVILAICFAPWLDLLLDMLMTHLGLWPNAVVALGILIVGWIVDRAQRGGDG